MVVAAPPPGREEKLRVKKRERARVFKRKNNPNQNPGQETQKEGMAELSECFDTLWTLFSLFDLTPKTPGIKSRIRETTLATWVAAMDGKVVWYKFMKYKLAAFYAFHLGQQIPERPEGLLEKDKPNFLIGGGCARKVRHFMRANPVVGERTDEQADLGQQLLNSVLNAKKGLPRVSDEVLKAAEAQTVKDLTTDRPKLKPISAKPWGDRKCDMVDYDVGELTMMDQLRRTVREIFSEETYTDEDRVRFFFPSTSANYIRSRSKAGTVGELLHEVEGTPSLLDGLRTPGGALTVRSENVRNVALDSAEMKSGTGGVFVSEEFIDDSDSESEDGGEYAMPRQRSNRSVHVADDRELERRYATLLNRMQAHALDTEEPLVKAVGLKEPLKVRVISKGPPILYYSMRAIWKKMHSVLKRHKCFQLIGKPDNAEMMCDILGTPKGLRTWFCSGDYSAATNELDPRVSETIAHTIADCIGLTEVERTLLIRSLTQHIFTDVDELGEEIRREQRWGQLMGSITSFPILCIANFAMTRWAMEIAEDRTIPLCGAAIAINGDDVVFRSNRHAFQYYGQITAFAGLKLSVGKTFFSEQFFTINSRSYNILNDPEPVTRQRVHQGMTRTTTRMIPFRKTKFVNLGIIFGMKRADDGRGNFAHVEDVDFSPARRGEVLVDETPEHLLTKVFDLFIDLNKTAFKNTGLPWFMPTWLGGLGLPQVRPQDTNSELDKRIAFRILMNWNKKGCRPANTGRVETPWVVRQVAQEHIPEPLQTEDEHATGIKAWKRLSSLAVMNLLFDSNIELGHIYKRISRKPGHDALKRNRRLWDPAKGPVPGEMIPEAVLQRRRVYDSMAVVFQSDIGDSHLLARTHDITVLSAETSVPLPYTGPRVRTAKEISNGVTPMSDFRSLPFLPIY